jgi:hypothetical protein
VLAVFTEELCEASVKRVDRCVGLAGTDYNSCCEWIGFSGFFCTNLDSFRTNIPVSPAYLDYMSHATCKDGNKCEQLMSDAVACVVPEGELPSEACCAISQDLINNCNGGYIQSAANMYLQQGEGVVGFPGVSKLFKLLGSCQRELRVGYANTMMLSESRGLIKFSILIVLFCVCGRPRNQCSGL